MTSGHLKKECRKLTADKKAGTVQKDAGKKEGEADAIEYDSDDEDGVVIMGVLCRSRA